MDRQRVKEDMGANSVDAAQRSILLNTSTPFGNARRLVWGFYAVDSFWFGWAACADNPGQHITYKLLYTLHSLSRFRCEWFMW